MDQMLKRKQVSAPVDRDRDKGYPGERRKGEQVTEGIEDRIRRGRQWLTRDLLWSLESSIGQILLSLCVRGTELAVCQCRVKDRRRLRLSSSEPRDITVPVKDKCEGCPKTKVDMSQEAFKKLGADLSKGVVDIKWQFVKGPCEQK
ncbi:lytic transglycosylase domain-containing protein [Ditylenchus destructor]|nr:lytic transglycosylase domain-containing protein [Ditylenchus destructor]